MGQEIDLRKNYLKNNKITSIYFGGGTPSLLDKEDFDILLNKLNRHFELTHDIEITAECNPDDLDLEKLKGLKSVGVSRLSIGAQSFHDKELIFLGRNHRSDQIVSSIALAKSLGFNNISLDLIYGLPDQSIKSWSQSLDIVTELDIPHISAYCLTVEPKTKLHNLIKNNKIFKTDDKIIVEQYHLLKKKVQQHQYIQYEISNFGKEGYFSNHNIGYWRGGKYLGIGPSAHSYNGVSRQWNVSNNTKYINRLNTQKSFFNLEKLSNKQRYNEYIFTSLRTMWGLDLEFVKENFGKKLYKQLIAQVIKLEIEDKLIRIKNKLQLTEKGKLYADSVSSTLFIT